MDKLVKVGFYFNLFIIGDGDEKENLCELIKGFGFDDYVNFYGKIYEELEIVLLIMLSDVCILLGEIGLIVMYCLGYGVFVIIYFDNKY